MNTMCGIRITGENHVTIAPKPGGDITFARASYWSICGNVTTSWERTENGYRLTVGIPANTTAEILLPDGTAGPSEPDSIGMNGNETILSCH